MNTLALKKFFLWLATVTLTISGLVYFIALICWDLDLHKETALIVALCAIGVIVICIFFLIGRGARWDNEIKEGESKESIGVIH